MKWPGCLILCLSGLLMFAHPTYAQECAALNYVTQQCGGPGTGCSGSVVIAQPWPGQVTEIQPYYVWCCNNEFQDYDQEDCIPWESSSIRQAVMEFASTNTLWM